MQIKIECVVIINVSYKNKYDIRKLVKIMHRVKYISNKKFKNYNVLKISSSIQSILS